MDSPLNFQSVFHALPNAYLLVDPNLIILDVNRACLRSVDRKKDDVVGRSLMDLFPQHANAASISKLTESYHETLAKKSQVVLPLLHYTSTRESAAGSVAEDRYWNVTHVPVLNDDGSVTCIITHAVEIAAQSSLTTKNAASTSPDHAELPMPAHVSATPWSRPGRDNNGVLALASRSLRVLLVEDNEDLKETTTALIETLGHHVVAVDNAERALDLLVTESFDVLFTDLSLPKSTGAELAREALQRYPSMRVIITSGYGRAMANARNLDAVFLPKPYQLFDIQIALDDTHHSNL